MKLLDYQAETSKTAIYPDESGREYLFLGLVNEAGEVAGVIKKAIRDNEGHVNSILLSKELGDVLWYISEIANRYGINLEHVLEANIAKLQDRKERGVLGGSGDER